MDAVAWDRLKKTVPVGSEVSGRVVGCAPFGVFVDLGIGFLGLLELPEFADAVVRSRGQDSFPSVGDSIAARVLQHIEGNQQLRLTQNNIAESEWSKIRALSAAAENDARRDSNPP